MKIKIAKNQYLKDILTEIPSNNIVFKTLTNIGATTLEISAERNSIIIEPNVPVIKGKRSPGILGIYEGITVDQIIDYLNGNTIYKKILVTPESFSKIKDAIEYTKYNLHKDFFLLFDECDRTIRDADYRKGITLPINDFFHFESKAFISATALTPSDPRFEEHGFKQLAIEPSFDYLKPMDLVTTNNVYLSLQKVIEANPSNNYCIFFNSTYLISSIIKRMAIDNDYQVFCSRDSVYSLKASGFKNASEHLTDYKKFNFFTSRFFTAVDMFPEVKPVIIMLTDLVAAPHSMIDPNTDAVQIIGRFRKGYDKVIHISNTDTQISPKSEEEIIAYLQGCEESYTVIKTLAKSATNPGAIDTLNEALKLISYANYLNEDESKNHFMIDNTFLEEKIKNCYVTPNNLFLSYNKSKHFKVNHTDEEYPLSDINDKLVSGVCFKKVVKVVIEALNKIYDQSTLFNFDNDNRNTVLSELTKRFPEIVSAYSTLGPIELAKVGYSKGQIKKAIQLKNEKDGKSNFKFLKSLQNEFEDGLTDSTVNLKTKLAKLILKHNLDLKPEIKLLEEFFVLSKRKTIRLDKENNEVKGYTLVRSKFTRKK
ncbi:hypothetical protein SAMN05421813_11762 [Daejeonella rubra]|uniref:Uncharacterized protein n=1 Tax=Daejeonella rubra TaxID=990371 RepID=A0A1G9URW6_9SPHI|nr:hypothetical protein [Daejeonella rubra]SDM62593.1 hypothetical protein SAMN05421813_11762 [Daejeonella rubra]